MPSLTDEQTASLKNFVASYSADTDPTGGALFFQNPAITSKRGTKFGQKGGVTIGDQVFSRTYGNQEVPNTPPIYANQATQPSPLELAKQNIINLTKGHRTEAERQQIVNTYSDEDIISASDKFSQLMSNLNRGIKDEHLEDVYSARSPQNQQIPHYQQQAQPQPITYLSQPQSSHTQ